MILLDNYVELTWNPFPELHVNIWRRDLLESFQKMKRKATACFCILAFYWLLLLVLTSFSSLMVLYPFCFSRILYHNTNGAEVMRSGGVNESMWFFGYTYKEPSNLSGKNVDRECWFFRKWTKHLATTCKDVGKYSIRRWNTRISN
jgi:hypothetical protein